MTHFGQTPSQLTNKEHPRRLPKEDCQLPLFSTLATIANISLYTPKQQQGTSFGSVVSMRCIGDKLVVCHANLALCYYRWTALPDGDGNPFTVRTDKSRVLPCAMLSASDEILKGRGRMRMMSVDEDRDRLSSVNSADSPTKPASVSFSVPPVDTDNKPPLGSNTDSLMFGALRKSFRGLGIFDFSQPAAINTPVNLQRKSSFVEPLERKSSMQLDLATAPVLSSDTLVGTRPVAFASSSLSSMSHLNVALSASEFGQSRVVSCGYWDNSLKIHSVDSLKEVASSSGHLGAISCVQLGYQGGHTIITGGVDGTCRVWVLEKPSLAAAFTPENYYGEYSMADTETQTSTSEAAVSGASNPLVCVHVLCGHQHPVKCISYSTDLDIVMSGSVSGLLCMHSVRKGAFIRSIKHTVGSSVDLVLVTSPGYLVAYCGDSQMHLFWVNGQHLLSKHLPDRCFRQFPLLSFLSLRIISCTGWSVWWPAARATYWCVALPVDRCLSARCGVCRSSSSSVWRHTAASSPSG